MGCDFGDLDNDGWLDFYVGTGSPSLRSVMPNRMFRNAGGRFFEDVTTSGGFGHLQKGHGVAFGDFDNDGDQDIYAVLGGAYTGDVFQNVLFENPGHGNHWITLLLEGVQSNRAALGTRIRIQVSTRRGRGTSTPPSAREPASAAQSATGDRSGTGHGYRNRRSYLAGHGHAATIYRLEMDQYYRIREGDQTPVRLDRR